MNWQHGFALHPMPGRSWPGYMEIAMAHLPYEVHPLNDDGTVEVGKRLVERLHRMGTLGDDLLGRIVLGHN